MDSHLIQNIFHLVCVFATIGLQLQCLFTYFRNEDISVIEHKILRNSSENSNQFLNSEANLYPSMSFCIFNPFLVYKLRKHGINATTYKNFLNGDNLDETLLKIDYDDVSVSLDKSLDNSTGYAMWSRIEGQPKYSSLKVYTSLRTSELKCFTLDAPKVEKGTLDSFGIILKNTFFPNKIRPSDMKHDEPEGFLITFHYPNQIFSPSNLWEQKWQVRENSSKPYSMKFRIRTMTTIKNRRKSENTCIEDQDDYHQHVIDLLIQKIGCRPVFTNTKLSMSNCTNLSKNPFSYENMTELAESNPPCNFIEHIDFTYHEEDSPDFSKSSYCIKLKFLFSNYN